MGREWLGKPGQEGQEVQLQPRPEAPEALGHQAAVGGGQEASALELVGPPE